MKLYKWSRIALAVGTVALLLAGCQSFGAKETSREIDPPQTDLSVGQVFGSDIVDPAEQSGKTMEVTLYYKDSLGYVAPVSMKLPMTESVARTTLEYMVDGNPDAAKLLPADFTGLIPKDTKIDLDIKKDDKLAVVDFSKEFLKYDPKDERKIVEAITWALTGFSTIDKVELRVKGTPLTEMPQAKLPIDEPLTRQIGINIETVDGVNIGDSMPVTLYFMNKTSDDLSYYVPVTRMISRTADVAQAAVEQLISGPTEKSALSAIMAPTAKLLGLKQQDGVVTVNLSDGILSGSGQAPSETMEAIVLSLTEDTNASKVQIQVNGATAITDVKNTSYAKPVSRPQHINELEL